MGQTTIIENTGSEFFLRSYISNSINIGDSYSMVDVEIREFRKDTQIYYSSLKRLRKAGVYIDNNIDIIFEPYLQCENCYTQIDNFNMCLLCSLDFTRKDNNFFLPLYYLIPLEYYNIIKSKYKLGLYEEFYRDQRTNVCTPFKQELLEYVMHPDKIEKLLKVYKIHWRDLDNYI